MFRINLYLCLSLVFVALMRPDCFAADGAKFETYYGYDDCIRLSNDTVTATLCPAAGGRVLEYSIGDKNMLYLPPGNEGWRMSKEGKGGGMDAGRFDIGPERMVQRGDVLWKGEWKGSITGPRSAQLVSKVDPKSGVRLIRDFRLAESGSRLDCTQIIDNVSDKPVSLCHWSRTFAVGRGVAIVPRSPLGRFPVGYVMYKDGTTIDFRPDDPNIKVSDDFVTISAAPKKPKLGFDSHSGWLAYAAPNDLLFVKTFKTFPKRSYNEMAGLTISVWYPDGNMVELEPIGPAEDLAPGQAGSFTETWWLAAQEFPADAKQVSAAAVAEKVTELTKAPVDSQ